MHLWLFSNRGNWYCPAALAITALRTRSISLVQRRAWPQVNGCAHGNAFTAEAGPVLLQECANLPLTIVFSASGDHLDIKSAKAAGSVADGAVATPPDGYSSAMPTSVGAAPSFR